MKADRDERYAASDYVMSSGSPASDRCLQNAAVLGHRVGKLLADTEEVNLRAPAGMLVRVLLSTPSC